MWVLCEFGRQLLEGNRRSGVQVARRRHESLVWGTSHHNRCSLELSVDGRPLSPSRKNNVFKRFQTTALHASSLRSHNFVPTIDTTFPFPCLLHSFSSNHGPRVVSHHREATPPVTVAQNVGTSYNRKIIRRMHARQLRRQRRHRRRR